MAIDKGVDFEAMFSIVISYKCGWKYKVCVMYTVGSHSAQTGQTTETVGYLSVGCALKKLQSGILFLFYYI